MASKPDIMNLINDKTDYLWEVARFKSFKKWPHKLQSKCIPSAMAQAGWYCTSTALDDPSARCAFCFKELNGWESTDDPWEEHSKHSQACAFLKLKKKEVEFTYEDVLNLSKARLLKVLEMNHAEQIMKLREERDKIFALLDEMQNKGK